MARKLNRNYVRLRNDWALRHGQNKLQAARDVRFQNDWAQLQFYWKHRNAERKAQSEIARLERLARERPLSDRERRQLTQQRRKARENATNRAPGSFIAHVQIRLGLRPTTAHYDVGDTP